MSSKVLRVGFCSTANIGSKNFIAASIAPGVEVVAVSSRSLEKARSWAKERNILKAYGSHLELLADPDIDAVYIPMPTGVRPAIVIAAAKAGKHVLSEKPIAPTAVEAVLMLQACRDANVVFMDGVMFMHNPRLSAIKEKTESEDFGDLKRVVGDFSFAGDAGFFKDNIRVNKKLEPLGCLGDLGVYNIRLAMFAYDWKKPATVSAVGHTMIDGVPIDMSTTLGFGDGRSASFTNSFASAFRQTANFVGTKQALDFDDFTLAGVESNSCGFNLWKEHGLTENALLVTKDIEQVKVEYEYPQEVAMWVKFKELAEGSLEDTAAERNFYADVSLDTQKVLDAAMQSAAQEGAAVKVAD